MYVPTIPRYVIILQGSENSNRKYQSMQNKRYHLTCQLFDILDTKFSNYTLSIEASSLKTLICVMCL